MTYTSFAFYVFTAVIVVIYYLVPLRTRWVVLLMASSAFYMLAYKTGWWLLLGCALLSYGAGLLLSRCRRYQKAVLAAAVVSCMLPWFCIKNGNFILGSLLGRPSVAWIVPLGISFYTMQITAYLADIYAGRIQAQKNFAKYLLFLLFFPQLVQGPIPRYGQLFPQLANGRRFDEACFIRGFQRILWGFFLKMMIADRAAVIVNEIFEHPYLYTGCYVLVGGALYSMELYADFLSCVKLAQGTAGLFGIELVDNFKRPYLACSVKEFWHRWHMSLSGWLRDYIYIPLGGSRKGRAAKYRNLLLTFAVSGIWHGAGYKYLFWGMLHAFYQIAGELSAPWLERLYQALRLPRSCQKVLQRAGVFFLVMTAWIIFRAESLTTGLVMVKNMLVVFNPWIFFNDKLLTLGLDWKEWCVLALSAAVWFWIERRQEQGICMGKVWLQKPAYLRFAMYLSVIVVVMVFGSYGFGYEPTDFIYRGF